MPTFFVYFDFVLVGVGILSSIWYLARRFSGSEPKSCGSLSALPGKEKPLDLILGPGLAKGLAKAQRKQLLEIENVR